MSGDIDPNAPAIRIRVIAKSLERLASVMHPQWLSVTREGVESITSDTGEILRASAELAQIAAELDPL